MRFWHLAWAPYWGRTDVLARSDAFYADYLPNATSVAAAQGYRGARFPKMISAVGNRSGIDVPWLGLAYAPLPSSVHNGSTVTLGPLLAWESNSGVGPLLVWQQAHSIILAEAERRAAAVAGGSSAARATMEALAPVVWATADFLASFPYFNASTGFYSLGPPLYGGEEGGNPLAISDPAFELVQIGQALDLARAWRVALGLPASPAWDAVAGHLARPPLDPASQPPLYAVNAACACLYNPQHSPCPFSRLGCPTPLTSHPMTSGLVGMLNGMAGGSGRYGVDAAIANATVAATASNWSWGTLAESPQVWGWDPPLVALAQARLGWSPDSVVDMLLLNVEKNQYNAVGVNEGMGHETVYIPGNGGILLAISAIAAGYDGGAPGAQLFAGGGPGAVAASPTHPLGFPVAWNAVVEGFSAPLP